MSGFAAPGPTEERPIAEATRSCILSIGLDRLARQAQYDDYARAVLDDYRRLSVAGRSRAAMS